MAPAPKLAPCRSKVQQLRQGQDERDALVQQLQHNQDMISSQRDEQAALAARRASSAEAGAMQVQQLQAEVQQLQAALQALEGARNNGSAAAREDQGQDGLTQAIANAAVSAAEMQRLHSVVGEREAAIREQEALLEKQGQQLPDLAAAATAPGAEVVELQALVQQLRQGQDERDALVQQLQHNQDTISLQRDEQAALAARRTASAEAGAVQVQQLQAEVQQLQAALQAPEGARSDGSAAAREDQGQDGLTQAIANAAASAAEVQRLHGVVGEREA